ncbi:MAG: ribosome recycling factor [Parachlamydiales bacterium]|jgi:ribosome recycling factor
MQFESDLKKAMQAALDHLKSELKGLRTNRANPAILDMVSVEVYGTQMKLKELANITVPESRQLVISPFDQNNLNAIGKAIEKANLNLQPRVDGQVIRITFPPMDEALRKEIAKQCKKYAEAAKVAIRDIRGRFIKIVKKQKDDKLLSEDELKKAEKKIQEFTDSFCKDTEALAVQKEKEILEI